jgi:AraC-like DNA-binding protein
MPEFAAHQTGLNDLLAVTGESGHSFARHTHDDYGIGLVVAGGQISASGRGQVEAGPGDIITVNPGEVHDGAPVGDKGRHWHMLYLSPDLLKRISSGFDRAQSSQPEFHNPVIRDKETARRFAFAWQTILPEIASDVSALGREEALLGLFGGLVSQRPLAAARSQRPAMARVKAMLDDDIQQNPSLEHLAHEAGLSRYQTLRAFAETTGFTPHAYLIAQRTRHARQLILAGSRLADAAAASGFADQSHMTREFRKRYGFTPAALRKAAMER